MIDFCSTKSRTEEWRDDRWDFVELKGARMTDFVDTFLRSSRSVSSMGRSVNASELSSELRVRKEFSCILLFLLYLSTFLNVNSFRMSSIS